MASHYWRSLQGSFLFQADTIADPVSWCCCILLVLNGNRLFKFSYWISPGLKAKVCCFFMQIDFNHWSIGFLCLFNPLINISYPQHLLRGSLLIAEVRSRFDPNNGGADPLAFINALKLLGFSLISKVSCSSVWLDYSKVFFWVLWISFNPLVKDVSKQVKHLIYAGFL